MREDRRTEPEGTQRGRIRLAEGQKVDPQQNSVLSGTHRAVLEPEQAIVRRQRVGLDAIQVHPVFFCRARTERTKRMVHDAHPIGRKTLGRIEME